MTKISILIHGYNKNKKDMYTLAQNLEKLNHKCILVDLPLTYKDIEYAYSIFEKDIKNILAELSLNEKINLIGHSTGGLIIRKYLLNTGHIDRIDNCVLIATPNNGSELADMASKYFNIFTNIYKTLRALRTEYVKKIEFVKSDKVRVGAIAGNKNNLLMGRFLKEENDGRINVSSVYYEGLNDFIVLPYGHKEIHYKWETASLVNNFIETGNFMEEEY
ncbi:alpha/beta fold hydrolase [Paramaledivibacter caminithermalis]|uniref:Alpha/beta hydrolase family protein n=1 Tax=Paramaledivibacter caminithermalis (strain DSM 15212 / CIP 107654 / DViRD3) TaxID=1121301 RepID=A0A1M6QV47_PARC5|nr:alpha/beta fold hydrolase [Paramaledivibacter caminithermalis]SHK24094.1 Alpha/beta hydrolase family protein [Paramaledivibacter caminithermalis DSM 15212]